MKTTLPIERQPIIYGYNPKTGLITYGMEGKVKKLPEYTGLVIDGTKVRITLKTGEVRHLPDCLKGYILKEANKYEIILYKP